MNPFTSMRAGWLERRHKRQRERLRERQAMAGPLHALPVAMPLAEARRVIVFAPHPDDETIGCGGLLLQLADAGVPTRVVLVSDGSGAGGLPAGAAAVRQAEFRAALVRLGVQDAQLLGHPDGDLRLDATLLKDVLSQVQDQNPDWVLCPSALDPHRDHRVVAEAARRAACSCASVQRLWWYEISAPLPPTHVLDISPQLERKLQALQEHRTALACGNYLEATRALALYRSLLLGRPQAGAAAEAYLAHGRDDAFGLGWQWSPV